MATLQEIQDKVNIAKLYYQQEAANELVKLKSGCGDINRLSPLKRIIRALSYDINQQVNDATTLKLYKCLEKIIADYTATYVIDPEVIIPGMPSGGGGGGSVAKFIDLLDTPETYIGQANKLTVVSGSENELVFKELKDLDFSAITDFIRNQAAIAQQANFRIGGFGMFQNGNSYTFIDAMGITRMDASGGGNSINRSGYGFSASGIASGYINNTGISVVNYQNGGSNVELNKNQLFLGYTDGEGGDQHSVTLNKDGLGISKAGKQYGFRINEYTDGEGQPAYKTELYSGGNIVIDAPKFKLPVEPTEADDVVRLGDLSGFAKLAADNVFTGGNTFQNFLFNGYGAFKKYVAFDYPGENGINFVNGTDIHMYSADGSTQTSIAQTNAGLKISYQGNPLTAGIVFGEGTIYDQISGKYFLKETDVTGYIPYSGATSDIDLGTHNMYLNDLYGTGVVYGFGGFQSNPGNYEAMLQVRPDLSNAYLLAGVNGGNNATIGVKKLNSAASLTSSNGSAVNMLQSDTLNGFTIEDNIFSRGIQYKNDYSANFTARTLVDRGFVDNNFLKLAGGAITGDVQYNVAPVSATSLINKSYVDNLITGLTWKKEVRAKSIGNVTLSGIQTIDGVSGVADGRYLLNNQTNAAENGIWVMKSGAWVRATDADNTEEIVGATVMVRLGTINRDTQWTNTNTNEPVVGTDAITFAQISGAGTYTNGPGITLTGNVFALDKAYTDGFYPQLASTYADPAWISSLSAAKIPVTANRVAYGTGTGITTSAKMTFDGNYLRIIGAETGSGTLRIGGSFGNAGINREEQGKDITIGSGGGNGTVIRLVVGAGANSFGEVGGFDITGLSLGTGVGYTGGNTTRVGVIHGTDVAAGNSNQAGYDLHARTGRGTGTGQGGAFYISTSPGGASGSSQNPDVERFRIASDGLIAFAAGTTTRFNALTASRALVLDNQRNLIVSATTDVELGYVNGVTSAIQTQLDGKQATITGLTAGSILFANNTGQISQDNANFFWDNTNKRLGIGTATPSAILELSSNINSTIVTTLYTNSAPSSGGIGGSRARGTATAPLAIQTDDVIVGMYGQGFTSAGSFSGINTAAIRFQAAQNFTATAQGTYIGFATTPLNSASRVESMRLSPSGFLGIGTTDPKARLDVNGFGNASLTPAIAMFTENANSLASIEVRNLNNGTSAETRFLLAENTGAYLGMTIGSTGNTISNLFGLSRATNAFLFTQSGTGAGRGLVVGTLTAHDLTLGTAGTSRLVISSTGSVSISNNDGYTTGGYATLVRNSTTGRLETVAGSIVKVTNIKNQTSNRTLTIADWGNNPELTIYANAAGGGFTITLPSAASMEGLVLNVIKTENSANGVTVSLAGTNINGSPSVSLTTSYQTTTIQSNGTQFYQF